MPGGAAAMGTLCWPLEPPICTVKMSTPAEVPVWNGSTACRSPGAMGNATLRPPAAKAMAESAGTGEIQGGCPCTAGLRRSVEADDQRALLRAGRLVEVQQDGGLRQRRIGAGAEQRIAAVAQRERPLEYAGGLRREDDGEFPALAGSQRLAGGHRPQQGEIGALHGDCRYGEDQRGFVLDGDAALGGSTVDHNPEIQRAGKRRPGRGIDEVG